MMSWVATALIFHLTVGAHAQSDQRVDCTLQDRAFQFCRFDLLGDFDLYWSVNDSASSIQFAFDVDSASGRYYALGISPQRQLSTADVMPGTNAVVGCGDPNNALDGDLQMNDYELRQRAPSEVGPAGLQDLTDHSETRVDGRCTVFYTRPIAPEQLDENQHLVDALRTVVVATGSYGTSIQTHGSSSDDRTFFEVNFASGVATAPVDIPINPYWAAHGALMAISFGFFFPGGILAARHKKILFGNRKLGSFKLWFQVHRVMMPMGALLSTAGFILILVREAGTYTIGLHFLLGCIAIALIWSQFAFVRLRPKGAKKGEPLPPARRRWNLAHWWNGRTAAVLAFTNSVIGFTLLEPPIGYFVFFLLVAGLILITYIGLEIYGGCARKKEGAQSESKGKSVEMEGVNTT